MKKRVEQDSDGSRQMVVEFMVEGKQGWGAAGRSISGERKGGSSY